MCGLQLSEDSDEIHVSLPEGTDCPEVTVLQFPPPPPEEADVLHVEKTCMGLVLSCDCTPLLHECTSTPVWEHTVALVRYTLQQDACARPSFEPNEEVMLCQTIFLAMCQNFSVQPEVDIFASHRQHQLPRYYSADPNDQYEEGYNAFDFRWTPDVTVCVNSP